MNEGGGRVNPLTKGWRTESLRVREKAIRGGGFLKKNRRNRELLISFSFFFLNCKRLFSMEASLRGRTGEERSSSGFVMEAEEAESMRKELGLGRIHDLLPALLPAARRLARPPISRFPVGAAGLGSSGRIYLGANIEFLGVPLHHSIHAEQFLLANAALHSEPSVPFIAVSEFPCGHCRQFLQEIRSASQIQILVPGRTPGFRPLSYFLPNPFGPFDLLQGDAPLLLEPHFNDPASEGAGLGLELGSVEERLREAAMRAARASHAPYSGSASGFAMADAEGRVFAGSYAESAAHNPSLGPVQAAVVAFLATGGGRGAGKILGDGIVSAALAEAEGAAVSQEQTARVLLSAMSPQARFSAYRFRSRPCGPAEK